METRTINLIVPRGWHELDDKQLRYLFGLLADDYSSVKVLYLCLFRFARLGGTYPNPKKFLILEHSRVIVCYVCRLTLCNVLTKKLV